MSAFGRLKLGEISGLPRVDGPRLLTTGPGLTMHVPASSRAMVQARHTRDFQGCFLNEW